MKYTFGFILIIHGLIHINGFINAFYSADLNHQILGISNPIGLLWLIVFILFVVSASQFISNKKWFYFAFLAIFVSQILIIITWKEAKFGTITNLIILLVSLSAFTNHRFQKMVEIESTEILSNVIYTTSKFISEKDLDHLPDIIKKWLRNAKVIGDKEILTVRLKQKGEMRTKPKSKWMPFGATQYFNIKNPSFVWTTNVAAMPFLNMTGRDKLKDGNGEMLIKLAGLIPVVNESKNDKINFGAMIRYLAEICWFPSAALNNYMTWKSIDETSAKATFKYNDHSVLGVFSFSTKGDFISFEADRYYGGTKDATLESWLVEAISYKEFNGLKIPNKCKVTWKLPKGNFNWLNLEVTDIEFNPSKLY